MQKKNASGVSLLRRNYITVDNAIEHAGFGTAQLTYVLAAAAVFFTEGQLGMTSVILLPNIRCEWSLDKAHVMALLLSGTFMSLLGALTAGKMADRYGRRKLLIGSTFCIIFSTALSLLQRNFYAYLIFRNVVHFFVPFTRPSAICIAIEVTPRKWRWLVKTCMSVSSKIASATVTFACYMILGSNTTWRDLTFYFVLPSFIPLLIYFFLVPESPRYLFLSGREGEGVEVLEDLHTKNRGYPLGHTIKHRKDLSRGRFRDMLTPEFERTTWILVGVFFVKTFVMATLHQVMPLILSGGYCSNSPNRPHDDPCSSLPHRSLRSLAQGFIVGAGVVILTMFLSQIIGRRKSAMICVITGGVVTLSNVICQGKDLLAFKITMVYAFHHGAMSILTLFVQETYPTSIRATATSLFHSVSHFVGLFGPVIAMYGVLGHEREFFTIAGVLLVAVGMFIRKIKHDSVNEPLKESLKEFSVEDSDWDIELDYDMD